MGQNCMCEPTPTATLSGGSRLNVAEGVAFWGSITPIMENQMEKKMENEMETGII